MQILPVINSGINPRVNKNNLYKEQRTPAFCAKLDKHIYEKTNLEVLAEKYLSLDEFGNLPICNADLKTMKKIHKLFKKQPDILAQMYLTRDKSGCLPIHNISLEKMKEIHKLFKKQPKVLAKMHLTQDNSGKLPIHRATHFSNSDIGLKNIKEINKVFKKQPDVLAQIYMTKSCIGDLPIDLTTFEERQEMQKVIYSLATDSDLDIQTSIKLLKYNNLCGKYDIAIRALNAQLGCCNKSIKCSINSNLPEKFH